MFKRLWRGKSKFYKEFMMNLIKTIIWGIVALLLFIGIVRALFII